MPVERITIRSTELFKLRILHHYWLDDGATMFDALDAKTQERRLQDYDVRTLLEIRPTVATAAKLAGLQAVWKATSLGLVVGLPPDRNVPDDGVFEFTLRIVDPHFLAYTAYGLAAPASADVYDRATHRVLRFRSAAALYSNLTGCARGTGVAKTLFLSKEVPARQGTERIESLVNEGGTLVQLDDDPPGTATVVHGPVLALPGFATHADVPAIGAIPDIDGALPASGILLPDGAPRDTLALIRIGAVRSTDADFSCTVGGVAKPAAPVFNLRFKNRRTLWRRFDKSAPGSPLSAEGPLPLTYAGNPSTAQKPATHAVKLDRSGTVITNIVSEIFC